MNLSWVILIVASSVGVIEAGAADDFHAQSGQKQRTEQVPSSTQDIAIQLADLQRQIDVLRRQVEQLQAEVSELRAGHKEGLARAPTTRQVFSSPEAVVMAYLGASTWQERAEFVANEPAVRDQMQRTYELQTLPGKSATGFRPDAWKKGKIQPVIKGADGSFFVTVDMTGLDEDPTWEYVVIMEGPGFKIDWPASLKLSSELSSRRQKERLVKEWGLTNAVLEVKVLKVEQRGTYAEMTIRVTNNSDAFLEFWKIGASVYAKPKAFLANASTNGRNLRSHTSVNESILLDNVNAYQIDSWDLTLKDAHAQRESGERLSAAQFFTLKETR